ncbi:hypothetical protein L484_016625 [Morus notabilis]|uniref:Uncharacterized protein n=1 Tax=Morus notabilis TaxID=981085 RepID=W9RUR1_9ROSA|nr:hypothetical protein L484_016625 [Morus notabilis]
MARIMTPKQTCLHRTTDLNCFDEDGFREAVRRVADGAMMPEIEPEDFRVEHFAKCLIDRGDLLQVPFLFKSPFSPSRGWLEWLRSVLCHKKTQENLEVGSCWSTPFPCRL